MKKVVLISTILFLFYYEGFTQTNTFPDSGNVGIGTTSPTTKLTVVGTTGVNGGGADIYANAENSYIGVDAGQSRMGFTKKDGYAPIIAAGSSTSIIFGHLSTPQILGNVGSASLSQQFTVIPNGNVGIGTMSPGDLLSVAGNSSASQFVSYNVSSPTVLTARTNQRISLKVDNGATEAISVVPGGNVGTSTTNPQSKLAVNGTITATEVKVTQTGWPDYVFDSAYHLPHLSATETFIKKNHHLPDMPSAKDVEDKGLNLGDMEKKQMQKIEELTLFIINMNKRQQALEMQVKQLAVVNKKLKQLEIQVNRLKSADETLRSQVHKIADK